MYMKSGTSKKKMDYFLAYYQLYYWRIRSPYDLAGEGEFFREVSQMISDTFVTVNPTLTLSKSFEDAEKAVKAGEEEIMKTLRSKAPQLLEAIGLEGTKGNINADGLQTIMEEDATEGQTNDTPLNNNGEKEHEYNQEENDSYDDSGSDSDDQDQEDNEMNEDVDVEDESDSDEDDEDTVEEVDDGDLIDTEDEEDSERKEMERDIEDWSVKSKPKLLSK